MHKKHLPLNKQHFSRKQRQTPCIRNIKQPTDNQSEKRGLYSNPTTIRTIHHHTNHYMISCLALSVGHVQNKIFTFGLMVIKEERKKNLLGPPERFWSLYNIDRLSSIVYIIDSNLPLPAFFSSDFSCYVSISLFYFRLYLNLKI